MNPHARELTAWFACWLLSCAVLSVGCQSPRYADRGAAVGAVTGALAGAAIGESSGDTAAGALIGTAVGTLTGAAIGDTIDQEVARSQAIIEERMGRQMSGAVTVSDTIAMTHAGLSDPVVISHIQANGVAHPPQVGDLIAMRDAGVSDPVIQALQRTPPPQLPQPPQPPVVVEEHHYIAPPYPVHWPRPRHPHWRHGHRGGFHWGVSISN